jgi:hypothetical protein
MCPACITAMALVAAGAGSTGGLTAFVARTLRRKRVAETIIAETNPESHGGSIAARNAHEQGAGK